MDTILDYYTTKQAASINLQRVKNLPKWLWGLFKKHPGGYSIGGSIAGIGILSLLHNLYKDWTYEPSETAVASEIVLPLIGAGVGGAIPNLFIEDTEETRKTDKLLRTALGAGGGGLLGYLLSKTIE